VPGVASPETERLFREYGRAVAVLIRRFGVSTRSRRRCRRRLPRPSSAGADWRQVLQLYDQLLAIAPAPWSLSPVQSRQPKSRGGGGAAIEAAIGRSENDGTRVLGRLRTLAPD
jgi:hypothetical protein